MSERTAHQKIAENRKYETIVTHYKYSAEFVDKLNAEYSAQTKLLEEKDKLVLTLVHALHHLTYNAKKSGANMGVGIEVAEHALTEYDKHIGTHHE